MNKLFLVALVIPITCFSQISNESKNLAWCEGVYIYYAQYFQLKNNEGAAKNLLFRSSRVITANLFLNLENGKVSGEKVAQFKEVRRNMKQQFDANPDGNAVEVSKCDSSVQATITKVKGKNQNWDGENFDSMQQKMMTKYLNTLGIKN